MSLRRYTPKEAKQMSYTPRPRAAAVPMVDLRDTLVTPVPKADLLDDREYRMLVATLRCICCNAVGFSQAAHPNTGKGMGMKTDDRECFPLCTIGGKDCHGGFDQRALFSKEKRRELEPLWAAQTRATLRKLAMFDAGARRIVERAIGL